MSPHIMLSWGNCLLIYLTLTADTLFGQQGFISSCRSSRIRVEHRLCLPYCYRRNRHRETEEVEELPLNNTVILNQ